MHRDLYLPEGLLLHTEKNQKAVGSLQGLMLAMENRTILEGKVLLCDAAHNLVVSLGAYTGIIPRSEAAIGIAEGETREIAVISRVGKAVAFHITGIETTPDGKVSIRLSRRSAQQEAMRFFLSSLRSGGYNPCANNTSGAVRRICRHWVRKCVPYRNREYLRFAHLASER